jgi:hypothetical protein
VSGAASRAIGTRTQTLIVLFVAVGIALRIANYAANRSLSIDEDFLSLNLILKSPLQLTGHLDLNQAAPIGFLELEKLAISIGGRSEFALRFIPLTASLAALGAFAFFARRVLSDFACVVSVAVFALFDPLIYYAAITKQYGLDVLAIVLLSWLFISSESRPLTRARVALISAAGGLAVWFSHAAVFVLAAIGLLLFARELRARRRSGVAAVSIAVGVWLANFGVEFYLTRANVQTIEKAFSRPGATFLTSSSAGGFAGAVARVRYLVGLEHTTTGKPIFSSDIWINQSLTVALVLLAVIGGLSLLQRNLRTGLLVTLPIAFVLLAAAAHRYPLVGRTLLFTFPATSVGLGEGIDAIRRHGTGLGRLAAGAAAVICVGAIAIIPAVHLVHPRENEEAKPVLAYLGRHHEPGDVLYVNQGALYSLGYYALCHCAPFDPARVWPFGVTLRDLIVSHSPRLIVARGHFGAPETAQNLRRVIGRPRVWFLIAETDEDATIRRLDRLGRQLNRFRGTGSTGHVTLALYNLAK